MEKLLALSLKFIEKKLEKDPYLCGKEITLADLSAAFEIKGQSVLKTDLSKYPNLQSWFKKIEEIPEVANLFKTMSMPGLEGNDTSARDLKAKL